MANLNQPNGFRILNPEKFKPVKVKVNASYTGVAGDAFWIDSAGYATDTAGTYTYGIQTSGIISMNTELVETTSSATAGDSYILGVIDPAVEFVGQMTTGALTDPYTTVSSAACFDLAGTAGVMYVDAGANTRDEIKVVRDFIEPDTGIVSAVGAYQKKVFRFNAVKHAFGVVA